MYLRFFVALDESPIGQLALAYMPALTRIAPVRLIDPDRMGSPDLPGRWARYHRAQDTPMSGRFVNLVCTRPARWTWVQRIEAAVENRPEDPSVPTEVIEGRLELYTTGVRNVLFVPPGAFPVHDDALIASARRYEAVITPRYETALALVPKQTVVPVPVTDHAAFRRTILGE